MHTNRHKPGSLNVTVIFAALMGIVLFVAAAWAGQPRLGLAMFAIMAVYAAVLWIGRDNDVVQILRGEPADERYEVIMRTAITHAANALAIAVVAMFVYEIATDGNPGPYSLMGFIFAVSMIGSLIWQRFKA